MTQIINHYLLLMFCILNHSIEIMIISSNQLGRQFVSSSGSTVYDGVVTIRELIGDKLHVTTKKGEISATRVLARKAPAN